MAVEIYFRLPYMSSMMSKRPVIFAFINKWNARVVWARGAGIFNYIVIPLLTPYELDRFIINGKIQPV